MELGTADGSSATAHPYPGVDRRRVRADPRHRGFADILKGEIPSPVNPPSGCRLHPRCPYAIDRCKAEEPEFRTFEGTHQAACHLVGQFGKS